MRCEDVIRELAAPSYDRAAPALTEHLTHCPACALWAGRAAQLDKLWEATRPVEPSSDDWAAVWTSIDHSLKAPAATEGDMPAPAGLFRKRNSTRSKVFPHRSAFLPVTRSHARRPAIIALAVLAPAAAILIAVGLIWHRRADDQQLQMAQIAQAHPVAPELAPSIVALAYPVKVDVEFDEGHQYVIRTSGSKPQVVDLTPAELLFATGTAKPVVRYSEFQIPVEDPWYVMFNIFESIANPVVASR
jgi:hypothetical protein